MKVLISTSTVSIVGGVQTHIQALLPMLTNSGIEVGLLHEGIKNANPSKITDQVPSVPSWSTENIDHKELLCQIQNWSPDVIYNHGMMSVEIEEQLVNRWPTFIYVHSIYGTCISGLKRWIRPDLSICQKVLGPSCLSAYFPRGCGGNNPFTAIKLYKQARRRQKLLKKYSGVMVASRWMFDECLRNGVLKDRLQILPLFPPGCKDTTPPPVNRGFSNRVLFAGRIVDNKGWDHALAAVKNASLLLGRELKLVVAGDGPDLPKMKFQSNKIGLNVEWLGWIDRLTMEGEMHKADLLIMPSLLAEAFGLIGIEAGRNGLPSVGYAVGGISDWLYPGETGECGGLGVMDAKELSQAIFRALIDQNHWMKLRIGAWHHSLNFTINSHIEKLFKIFDFKTKPDSIELN
jgi:glycosyltransferase involved in cell wall biosynthesis